MLKENKQSFDTSTKAIEGLWKEGFFKQERNLISIIKELNDRGNNFSPEDIGMALFRSKYLTRKGIRGSFRYIQKINSISKQIEKVENDLFSGTLLKKLTKNFKIELADLEYNFGKSGNCTAFLLRKILEKLIFITFAKKGLSQRLEDSSNTGRLVGLEVMINIASAEKIKNISFLTPKTAQEIKGIKFLGDVSAHNPLIDVDMKTILPQMPFIISAYKELAERL